jgi:hypothetical protein
MTLRIRSTLDTALPRLEHCFSRANKGGSD